MIETVNNSLSQTLYHVSSALLLPVLLAISVLLVLVLVMLGGFLRESCERRRVRAGLRAALGLVSQSGAGAASVWKVLANIPTGLPCRLTHGVAWPPACPGLLTKALTDLETEIADRLGWLGFFTRLGPMLGLLGTLIPFGPALAGLSTGNVQELSANLVTAFAATVVGLLGGCLTFAMGLVRRSWYSRDFDDLEYLVQHLTESKPNEATETAEVGRDGRRSDCRANQLV